MSKYLPSGIELDIHKFDNINKKFKKVVVGIPQQTCQTYIAILDVFEVIVKTKKGANLINEVCDKLEEKMLHLSYTFSLWDLCLCWKVKPWIEEIYNVMEPEPTFICIAKLVIYKEIPRSSQV